LSKLIEVFKKLNERGNDITLAILNQDITENVAFRQEVVEADIVTKVLFI
jgi:hypothetical protein